MEKNNTHSAGVIRFFKIKYFIVSLSCAILFYSCQQDPEKEAAKAAYDNFINELVLNNGEAAFNYISHFDIEYYSKILKIAQTGSRQDIATLDVVDKVAVIGARLKFPKNELLSFDTKSFFSNSVKLGLIGKNKELLKNVTIEKIEIRKGLNIKNEMLHYAIMKAHSSSQDRLGNYEELELMVYNENGAWKFYQTGGHFMTNENLKRELMFNKPNNISEEDFFAIGLAKKYGKSSDNILDNY
jgi:hypothetical protein